VRDRVGPCAREELVEQHAERIHVRTRVDVERRELRLLGAHVLRCAEEIAEPRVRFGFDTREGGGLRDAEVDDLRHRLAVELGHQDVRRLEVTVNDSAQVRVLHAAAHFAEQLEPRLDAEPPFVAVARDRDARHVLHREERPAVVGCAGIEDARDVRMREHRERLALELEARDHLARAHAELEELQGDLAPHRRLLLGEIHLAHRALAEPFEDPIGTYAMRQRHLRHIGKPRLEQRFRTGMSAQETPHALAELGVGTRGEQRLALFLRRVETGLEEALFLVDVHPPAPGRPRCDSM
jgi:hypothetical protein